MVKLIAHRGNYNGKNISLENHPDYIKLAIENGYDAECDVLVKDNKIFLGHDDSLHSIGIDFFNNFSNKLWIHCKNFESLIYFKKLKNLNYFWQKDDIHSLTSKGFIWSHSKCTKFDKNIACMIDKKVAKTLYKSEVIYGLCMDDFSFLNI